MDLSGFHHISVQWCDCDDAADTVLSHWQQCMRHQWFPATSQCPQTVFTFQVLNHFHKLSLQSKANLYDFYATLEHITDGSHLVSFSVSVLCVYMVLCFNIFQSVYKQMGHVIRLWRHLHLLKRSGRGHHPDGPNNTKPGQVAMECPACPHPDKNLPSNWQQAPPNVM